MRHWKVAVAVSGGVDSAVAALMLKQKGFNVQGVFMKNWDQIDETGVCSADEEYLDAKEICDKIKIPLTRVNFVKEYWNEVFSEMLEQYQMGFTPNPDVLCNQNIKFKSLFEYCQASLGVDAIATGHYAKTSYGSFLEKYSDDTKVKLLIPLDQTKDQTLFLSQVEQMALRKTMFPLADIKKTDVRKIAKQHDLKVANKRDSVGICFIGKRNFKDFMSEYVKNQPGDIISLDSGQKIGAHNGIHQWTLGQRCLIGGCKMPYYVAVKNPQKNILYAVPGSDHLGLRKEIIITKKPHWICQEPAPLKERGVLNCYFRFQHIYPLEKCQVVKTKSGLIVKLKNVTKNISPGQYAVFYDEHECFGSAQICYSGPSLLFY